MKTIFCNDCYLSDAIPILIAEELLGIQQLDKIKSRYKQMQECYDYSYTEWQQVFSENLKPFNGYTDTTSVCIPILNSSFQKDFLHMALGAIGLDLPTWVNIKTDNKRIMLIAQDPLRSAKWYEKCYDAVISSPFGLHDATHRKKGNGGRMANLLISKLVQKGFAVYLTDANKFFIHNRETSKTYSEKRINTYRKILQKELELLKPSICVCLGKRPSEVLDKCMLNIPIITLPHLSGTARGAIVKRFPILKEMKATAENIANIYATEIIESLKI